MYLKINDITVIKIGGSCITMKKEGIPKIRDAFLFDFVDILTKMKRTSHIVIVHGGGSITHPLVDQFAMKDPLYNGTVYSDREKNAAAKIHVAMNDLNNRIVSVFLNNGLSAWPIQTSAIFSMDNGVESIADLSSVRIALNNNIIPILHGDLVLDTERGSGIFSGDLVACLLAQHLAAQRLIFFTDVDGVYEWYKGENDHGDIVHTFSCGEKNEHCRHIQDAHRDHSGGMAKKIEYIAKYCTNVSDIIIANGLHAQTMNDVLHGRDTRCTKITF